MDSFSMDGSRLLRAMIPANPSGSVAFMLLSNKNLDRWGIIRIHFFFVLLSSYRGYRPQIEAKEYE